MNALSNFDDLFRGGAVVHLTTNYRSTPQIVQVADAVLSDESGIDRPTPRAPRPDGPAPSVTAYADEINEARGVAKLALSAHDQGTPWSQIAVLYRTNAQSAAFETAMRKLGVPFRLRGTSRFLDRPEVRVVLDDLRRAAGNGGGRPLTDLLDDVTDTARELGAEQREHVDAVERLAREYLAIDGGGGSVPAFLSWLETSTRGGDDPTAHDVVELSTFHAAKGLEWEVVFVTGLEAGLVPISYAKTPEARGEEQRLLHVALSRAGKELHVSWAHQRQRSRKPSPWLELVEYATAGDRAAALRPKPNPKQGLAGARAVLASKAPAGRADPEVYERLKQWRLGIARAHDIPAFTIFNNRTLEEIASVLPSTRAELLTINGVGPAKLEQYADQVLTILADRDSTD